MAVCGLCERPKGAKGVGDRRDATCISESTLMQEIGLLLAKLCFSSVDDMSVLRFYGCMSTYMDASQRSLGE